MKFLTAMFKGNKNIPDQIVKLLREYSEALLLAVVLAILVRLFFVSVYRIPTGSMVPSLKVGDFVFGSKLPYSLKVPFVGKVFQFRSPRRGDVIVFSCPLSPSSKCVKRIIGLEGDRVEIQGRILVINGQKATYQPGNDNFISDVPGNSYLKVKIEKHPTFPAHLVAHSLLSKPYNYGPVVVPPGSYFVLGDNRDSTDDSRNWGMVSGAAVEGKIVLIWLSLDWLHRGSSLGLPTVRWNRLFQVVR